MVDLTQYYTAEKAKEQTEAAKQKKSDDTFRENLAAYRNEYDQIINLIKNEVEKGNHSLTYFPKNPDKFQDHLKAHKLAPDTETTFSVGQRAIFAILNTLGYRIERGHVEIALGEPDLSVPKRETVPTEVAKISW